MSPSTVSPQNKIPNNRIISFAVVIGIIFLIFVSRLFFYQILNGDTYIALAVENRLREISLVGVVVTSLYAQALALICAMGVCVSGAWLGRLSARGAWLGSWLVVIIVALAFSYSAGIVGTVLGVVPGRENFGLFVLHSVLVVALVSAPLFRYLFVRAQWRTQLEAESEARVQALQARIRPHFLFNSLNTLSSLVYEDSDRSAEFIRKLSDVYRHVLETRQKELIKISEELHFIESYIFLLELRFDKKLIIEVNLEGDLMDRKIAPLSLQMLIENAVKHNIVSDKKPLNIKVYNNDKYIIVENPVQPKASKEKGSQMGLRNISSRYKALCGEEIIINDENNKFTVKVPII